MVEFTPCNTVKVILIVDICVLIDKSLMVKIQNFEKEKCVWIENILSLRIDEKFFFNKKLLSFQTPLESPSCLKSQQFVPKGNKLLFTHVSNFLFSFM